MIKLQKLAEYQVSDENMKNREEWILELRRQNTNFEQCDLTDEAGFSVRLFRQSFELSKRGTLARDVVSDDRYVNISIADEAAKISTRTG
ncbi:hypothetical protein BDC45DRAFT_573704 [Circinella umbellata]|nr:hypothetical protein BDC45DRAFT_573704 [Circinella umbellata]